MSANAEPLFPGTTFSAILSLGADCETANGLRLAGLHGTRGLFDWLVTPLDSIAAILADDGARLADSLAAVQRGTSARCEAYGVLCHHELPRDSENQIVFSTALLEACRSKLRHKMQSFVRACEDTAGPILFLRVGPSTNLPWDCCAGKGMSASDADKLACALARRFPNLDFRLLVAVLAPARAGDLDAPCDPRVCLVDLPCRTDGGWRVAKGDWLAFFSRLAFSDGGIGNRPIGETLFWFGVGEEGDPGNEIPVQAIAGDDAADKDDLPAATTEELWTLGKELLQRHCSFEALRHFREAFDRGGRDLLFLRDYLGLLTGEVRYEEVLQTIARLRDETSGATTPRVRDHIEMLSGHAKIAIAIPRDGEIASARTRSDGGTWLDAQALRATIAAAIEARRPFAFIRLGDGEARFLLSQEIGSEAGLTHEERQAMGTVVWDNWFGEPLSAASPEACARLRDDLAAAVASADVVGACSPERLTADTGHYGYLAWQERWLRVLLGGRTNVLFTDAQCPHRLNEDMPFLSALLEGLDFLGVVSPHPDLAEALGKKLAISEVASYVVPGEGRLPSAEASRAPGRHFPTVYETLLATVDVPRPGCVFLVAAGLLGKIYCARIKALGGIALDIGALVDAWMGFDTRDGQLAGVARLQQGDTKSDAVPRRESPATMTCGCISFAKTGSMALADAVRMAGFPDAVHLHYLGPRALALKQKSPEPMLDLALRVAGRIADPAHGFRLVTAVRDPIARILSQAFYIADDQRKAHGIEIVRDHEAVIEWWNARAMSRIDAWTMWFDDTFKATFGFDFREHAFDHERKSLRYASGQLRLLVLRQEDEREPREAELGWLLERGGVKLRDINDAANQGYEAGYRLFLKSFKAPSAWLDEYYDSEAIKHFYTEAELYAFRMRWRGHSRSSRLDALHTNADPSPNNKSLRLPNHEEHAAACARTFICLSMMKTGSTALTAALREASVADDVAHLHHLGPRARAQLVADGRPVEEIARRAEEPDHRFAIVTSVREPIARWISQAFHNAPEILARTGRDIVADDETFIAWLGAKAHLDYSCEWFSDSLEVPFGFDFRNHPFDQARKSLRFETNRLRLLVLRQEDTTALKEVELGWLADRANIKIPRLNGRATALNADRYRLFCETFVAPPAWLDDLYENDVARHFYTDAERDAFRARWSRR